MNNIDPWRRSGEISQGFYLEKRDQCPQTPSKLLETLL